MFSHFSKLIDVGFVLMFALGILESATEGDCGGTSEIMDVGVSDELMLGKLLGGSATCLPPPHAQHARLTFFLSYQIDDRLPQNPDVTVEQSSC